MRRPRHEVADIIRRYGAGFARKYCGIVTARVAKVLRDLQICRTAVLGGHQYTCVRCGDERYAYKSCGNRHCPKCGAAKRAQWLEAQAKNLLQVPYFHIVFTLPESIADIALQNRRLVYGLLFRAASQTLMTLAADPVHLGAKIGMTMVLHTWGQRLNHHPHVHCVVPGGGISLDGTRWVKCRNNFFVSVKVMRKLFRGKFLALLSEARERGELELHGRLAHLRQPRAFRRLLKGLRKKKWVVYAKAPFGGPLLVLKYLARYTHRVAIANSRIVDIDNGVITFRYKDYRDGQHKHLPLSAGEFLRRFTMHILPSGFQRIRHYGLLANRGREKNLNHCRALLGSGSCLPALKTSETSTQTDEPDRLCKKCNGKIFRIVEVDPIITAGAYVFQRIDSS